MKELRGAVARGWCSKRNEHKVMDVDLAEDISQEVKSWMDKEGYIKKSDIVVDEDKILKIIQNIKSDYHSKLITFEQIAHAIAQKKGWMR